MRNGEISLWIRGEKRRNLYSSELDNREVSILKVWREIEKSLFWINREISVMERIREISVMDVFIEIEESLLEQSNFYSTAVLKTNKFLSI